ncbi:DUF2975 domain-containing protein [Shewanella sp. WXL01]|uniref:DUF2975 domain-containing protein n=1 Tax=Shewanella sp. WXL01 TaxID=2709721 RepID=UPI001438630A|nr:DUF2975 domain-containing protein [Shewanella sp. WXL01]NKF49013.1 DUF2975 domain-containing protein [Shewanella sp. WXL01]
MERITRLSRWINILLLLLATLHLASYITVVTLGEAVSGQSGGVEYQFTLSWWGWFESYLRVDFSPSWQALVADINAQGFHAGLLVGAVEVLPYLFIYGLLARLFSLYSRGEVFSRANFTCFTRIAYVFFAWVLLSLFYPLLLVVFLRLFAGAEPLSIYLSIGSDEIKLALVGLIFYCVGYVMQQAHELDAEAQLTI